MMRITIENVDERMVAALERRAAGHDHSLEQEVGAALVKAAHNARPDRREYARRLCELTPVGVLQTDSTDIIRQFRDQR